VLLIAGEIRLLLHGQDLLKLLEPLMIAFIVELVIIVDCLAMLAAMYSNTFLHI